MNKLLLTLVLLSAAAFAQFRDDGIKRESVMDGIVTSPSSSLFGFLNSDNFIMRHSVNMSYSAMGGHGVALGIYTNSMFYRIAENLDANVDISIVNSPYSTFGENFQNNINGLYLSRAAINYRPWKDVAISLQYRHIPAYFYSPYDSYYGRGFLNRNYFNDPFFR